MISEGLQKMFALAFSLIFKDIDQYITIQFQKNQKYEQHCPSKFNLAYSQKN